MIIGSWCLFALRWYNLAERFFLGGRPRAKVSQNLHGSLGSFGLESLALPAFFSCSRTLGTACLRRHANLFGKQVFGRIFLERVMSGFTNMKQNQRKLFSVYRGFGPFERLGCAGTPRSGVPGATGGPKSGRVVATMARVWRLRRAGRIANTAPPVCLSAFQSLSTGSCNARAILTSYANTNQY